MEPLIGVPGYRTTRSTKGIPPHAYAAEIEKNSGKP